MTSAAELLQPRPRRRAVGVRVGNVLIAGGAPGVVQSMTNTDTADVAGTAKQVAELDVEGKQLTKSQQKGWERFRSMK